MRLNVNYDMARTVGTNVMNKAEEFMRLLNEIEQTNNTLAENWLGDDATKYTGAIRTYGEEQKQLQKTIHEAGLFTKRAGDTYQAVMEGNRDSIKSA